MSVNVVLVGVLAAALVGAPVAPRVGVQAEARREPGSYAVRASVASHRVVEDSGFVEVSGRVRDGPRAYRVVKPATRGLRTGTSKPMRVVVLDYEWSSLLGRHVALHNVGTPPIDVAGTHLDGRLTLVDPGQPGYADFDLGGRCEEVEVGTGMAKTSAPGSMGWANLHRDNNEYVTEVYNSDYSGDGGPSLYSGLSVADAGRIRIELGATPTPAGYPSVYGLRAFCAA